jgi:Glycosyl transferase family 2
MSKRLSVCLFTRDEARTVGRAVRSVEGVADEVIVVDTGSTDGTLKIVRDLGATVVPHTWADDFSVARNAALAAATSEWVFWLNPDEELTGPSQDVVRNLVAAGSGPDAFAYLVRIQSIPRRERPDLFTEMFDLRLFRRRPDVTYVGRLHPGFPAELAEAVSRDGQFVGPCDAVIRHHAYDRTVTPAKLRWAARLLEKELHDRPGRLHYLLEYARTLLQLDDPRGHDVMAEAAEQVRPHFDAPQAPSPDVQKLLEYLITTPPAASKAAITAEQAAELTMRWFAESPPLIWALAGSYFQARRFQAAAVLLELLVKLGSAGRFDRSQPFDPRILGPWALINLGQCWRVLGRPDRARLCFASLLDEPDFRDQATQLLAETEGAPSQGE